MPEWQGDLFSGSGFPPPGSAEAGEEIPAAALEALDDDCLSAVLSGAGLAASLAIVAEIERRKSAAAIPALERLCRRFAGFGRDRIVPEQVAALRALVGIGGKEAREAVARLIAAAAVEGPGLTTAVEAAADLGSSLPAEHVVSLLRRDDPALRAAACRCLGRGSLSECVATLGDLLGDLHGGVRAAAACALGRMGRWEGRDVLLALLHRDPSAEVIDAIAQIANEDVIVALGRLARDGGARYATVIAALDDIDHPRATQLAAALRAAAPAREE